MWTRYALLALTLAPPAAEAQTQWSVSSSPDLVLGAGDAGAEHVFHEINGVVAAGDGLVAVSDASQTIRLFTEAGRLVRTFGGVGDGPREFRSLRWLSACGGDRLVAYDVSRDRITVWSIAGELLDGFTVPGTSRGRPAYAVACDPVRRESPLVVVGWPAIGARDVGPYRPSVQIGLVDWKGRLVKVLATVPGTERYRYPGSVGDGPRRLGKATTVQIGNGSIYVGTADSAAVRVIRADGTSHRLAWPAARAAFTEREKREYREALAVLVPEERRPAARRALAELQLPDSLPAHGPIQVDRLGVVWVAPYRATGLPELHQPWVALQPTGEVVSVMLPDGFRPFDIGRDHLLGVATDTLGVETVVRYRLRR